MCAQAVAVFAQAVAVCEQAVAACAQAVAAGTNGSGVYGYFASAVVVCPPG